MAQSWGNLQRTRVRDDGINCFTLHRGIQSPENKMWEQRRQVTNIHIILPTFFLLYWLPGTQINRNLEVEEYLGPFTTKHHRMVGYKPKKLFLIVLSAGKSKIKTQAQLVRVYFLPEILWFLFVFSNGGHKEMWWVSKHSWHLMTW